MYYYYYVLHALANRLMKIFGKEHLKNTSKDFYSELIRVQ
jgi:hypothetical protein